MKLEGAPNKLVHAEDLAEALAKLHHRPRMDLPASPMSEVGADGVTRQRSGSSTTIYHPSDHGDSPHLPAIAIEDFTDEVEDISLLGAEKTIMAHTSRPPVELMEL